MKQAKSYRRKFTKLATQKEVRDFLMSERKIQVRRDTVCQFAPQLNVTRIYGG